MEIISHILTNKDGLTLLPTGGGKSICFQVPGMIKEGLTLVISPLIALMQDQVEQLAARDIRALALHSGMSWQEVLLSMENALQGHYKFLYVSPERLISDSFREYLPNLNISMLVIDEAHCVSQWGYNFRPPYLRIAEVQELFNKSLQMVAFTATATPKVKEDIIDKLGLQEPFIFQGDFARPNLKYGCINAENKNVKLVEICNQIKGSGIVFTNSRREAEIAAELLQSHHISADFYHAGLTNKQRSSKQNLWMKNKVRMMVCTNAFGMGVDKPDVRLVLHMKPSLTPEGYYQEAGRAGRDGKESWCILLYEAHDFKVIQERLSMNDVDEPELGRIYNAVLNHLSVPPGGGSEQVYKLNISEVANAYNTIPNRIYNGIKALQILDIWTFQDSSWSPSKVRIIGNAASIYELKVKHKEFEPLLDFLMRSFAGIFNSYVQINEAKMAKYLHSTEGDIQRILKKMMSLGFLDFQEKSEKSTLFLHEERTVYANFDADRLIKIQQDKKEKFNSMISYSTGNQCRNKFWMKYFLDEASEDCGNCDYCSNKQKSSSQSTGETRRVIEKEVREKKYTPQEFLNKVPKRSFDLYQRELRWLIDHKYIRISKEGKMKWKNE